MMVQQVRSGDAETRLVRALTRHAGAAGVTLEVEHCRSRPWSSATFEGVQFELTLALSPAAIARLWLNGLADAELPMRGHVAMPPSIDAVRERGGGLGADVTVLVLIDV